MSRSSNSPRYFAPATSAPMSSATMRLFCRPSGTSPRDDALRQALDDGGLADARLADEHRVVLGAARQHLDDAADLLVAADHRVELALARELRQVAAVALQGLVLVLRVLVGHALAAADARQRLEDDVLRDATLTAAGRRRGSARPRPRSRQQVLRAHVLVLEPRGLFFGRREDLAEPRRHAGVVRRRGRSAASRAGVDGGRQRRHLHVQSCRAAPDDAFGLLDERSSRCSGSICGLSGPLGQPLRRRDRLLRLFACISGCSWRDRRIVAPALGPLLALASRPLPPGLRLRRVSPTQLLQRLVVFPFLVRQAAGEGHRHRHVDIPGGAPPLADDGQPFAAGGEGFLPGLRGPA